MILLLFLWTKILISILPIISTGILLLLRFSNLDRIELIIPAGVGLGFSFFIFLLNFFFHFIKGESGVILSYAVVIFLLIILIVKRKKITLKTLSKKFIFFWLLSSIIWGIFIFWKVDHPLIGGDIRVYYPISSAFLKGNYPPVTPWQPDVALSYHIGTFELLGATQYLTSLSFEFLHLFLSFIFIYSAVQIVIWVIGRHEDFISFFLANLAALVGFVSFGFFKIVFLNFPIHINPIRNINEFIIWLRNLPQSTQSIETYGVVTNIDSLIYVIFHSAGLLLFLSISVFILFIKKRHFLSWVFLLIILPTLALIDESIFVASFPAFFLVLFLQHRKSILLYLLFLSIPLIVLFQGGVISSSIFSPKVLDKSVFLFPQKGDVNSDFMSYHLNSIKSKFSIQKDQWQPFTWFNVGADLLLVVAFLVVMSSRVESRNRYLFLIFSVTSLSALITYMVIVPKYILANSNRILGLSFFLSAILFTSALIPLTRKLFRKPLIVRLIYFIIVLWIFIPTILPPLTSLSLTRFGEHKLVPKTSSLSPSDIWMKNNLIFEDRTLVLDGHAPHPSGVISALINTGVSSPVFAGGYRTYTVEPGPEYTDIVYSLSPEALKKLKISYLVINRDFFEKMPVIRKIELEDEKYFTKVFDNGLTDEWIRIYKITPLFLSLEELPGTILQLTTITPEKGSFYIDDEKNFKPDYIRRPIIFSLRGRDLYFISGSGIYQHVETPIPFSNPKEDGKYDFFVLSKKITPKDICQCAYKLIWQGLNDEVFLYERVKSS